MNDLCFLRRIVLLPLLLILVASPLWARAPEVNPGIWIVELSDPPTAEFRGGVPESVLASKAAEAPVPMAATSPGVTGASRLDTEAPEVQSYVRHLDTARRAVLDQAADALGRALEPKFVYRHLQNGFAVEMTEAEAERLRAVPGVRAVVPDLLQFIRTDQGPQWINAPEMWTGSTGAPNPNRGEGMVLGVIDTGINWESVFIDPEFSRFPLSNPRDGFLGLCNDETLNIPCTDKLIGVYDFTDEGTNGFDPDTHGTHVATTAVGLSLSFSLNFGTGDIQFETSGVAPRASLISYKACEADPDSPSGNFQCPGSATSAALEQAIEDQVDAVNFSIGSTPFNPWSTGGNQRAFLNMRTAGIVPVTSAGNGGPNEFTVGSPANVPWILSVANATHGRYLGTRLENTSGGDSILLPVSGRARNSAGTDTVRPIVYAGDFGNALCGTGTAELQSSCGANTGSSNPFPAGTFNGEIVVCDRGTYGRVEKGKNLQLAGAGGMILANTESAGGESTVSDEHCLPAMHIGAADGDRLRAWLASGSDHEGRLSATSRIVDARESGLLNNSSARGPAVGAPNLMKPNVTAPGTDILAGGTETNEEGTGPSEDASNQIGILSGTSMASPHVAGAALLLRAAHPEWGVSEVISALETTADPLLVKNGDRSVARIIDRGAGGIQVDQAAKAGLFLPVTEQEFLDADPASGGEPGELNLPGILSENCADSCSFVRTVQALAGGTWTVTGEGDVTVEVEPSSFSLAAGETQTLQIRIRPQQQNGFGQWSSGSVVLSPGSNSLSTQRLPVGVLTSAAELPGPVSISAASNRGSETVTIPSLVEIDELVVRTSALVIPEQFNPTLAQDPTNRDPFDASAGTSTQLIEVGEGALLLHVQTFASTATDIDLFVGFDANGDGQPQDFEQECESTTPDDLEICRIEEPRAGQWWVRVQNWTSSESGSDAVPFEVALLEGKNDPSLTVEAPGNHLGGPLPLNLAWDQPALERNERALGAIALASSPERNADIGVVPLSLTRISPAQALETALFVGKQQTVIVPARDAHDRLYLDVPSSATGIQITANGNLTGLDLRRRVFSELVESVPETPAAPVEVLVEATRSDELWTIDWPAADGGALEAGRYYVVADNAGGASETKIEISAEITESAAISTQRGLWSPSTRSLDIRQGIDWQQGGDNSFVVWYTFDDAGAPTFYISDAVPLESGSSVFQSTLFRFTSNNERQTPMAVGEVQLTAVEQDRMMFAWRINGRHGAEMLGPIHGDGCPLIDGERAPALGHWFVPGEASGGVTLLATDIAEAWIRYYYDADGQPRWAISADTGLTPTLEGGERLTVFDIRGFCVECEEFEPTLQEVGTLERVFIDDANAREVLDFSAGEPISTRVQADRQVVRLSNSVGCPVE